MTAAYQTKIMSVLMALALVNLLLLAPQWLIGNTAVPDWLALEAPIMVGAFALMPRRRWSVVPAAATVFLLLLLSVLTFADVTLRQSLARPLNLYLDVHLFGSVVRLLTGTLGPLIAGLGVIAAIACIALLAWWLTRLLLVVGIDTQKTAPRRVRATLLGCVGLLVGLHATTDVLTVFSQRTALPAVSVAVDQTRYLFRMLNEQRAFEAELTHLPPSYTDLPNLLGGLEGRDVVLGFVESYGMSALEDPRYAPVLLPRLDELAQRVEAAGLHLTTGTLEAPTQGGQSWFSHGSLLSGTWLNNQLRYDLLLASGRETLIDDFRRAGYRTVALMPAITMAWPEGERFGYDEVLAHKDIDYAGPALNWVTMPDQFIWSFLEHTVRDSKDEPSRPLFAELGLISSHAPWTPILPVLDDWDGIGDGSVFAPWKGAGERPVDLWRDPDRVREHYALSVDYAIAAMTGFAERYVDDRTLLIVLGDHQPAPLITGEDARRDVPVHVVSGDPALVQPFTEWGFKRGALPDPHSSPRRMDTFRDFFLRAFSHP